MGRRIVHYTKTQGDDPYNQTITYASAKAFFGDWESAYDGKAKGGFVGCGYTGGHAHPSGGVPFHMCVPARNGCSKFQGLCQQLMGKGVIGDFRKGTSPDGKEYFKVAQVRNPVKRALSSWAFWRSIQEAEIQKEGACHNSQCDMPPTFAELAANLKAHAGNLHWEPQTSICHGHFDFIGKIEKRAEWQPNFFAYTNLAPAMDVAQYVDSRCDDACHKAAKLCKHYTRNAFQDAVQFYQQDIERFGYKQEIEQMAKTLETDCWK